jgi:hypothetical protein
MTDLANLADRFCKMNCPVHATEQGWPHDPDCETLQAAVRVIASARITGDKDRENPVEGAPTNRWLAIEVKRLRNVLRYITELAYVDHQSGNQNYEYLQGIADSALRINAHTDHPHD